MRIGLEYAFELGQESLRMDAGDPESIGELLQIAHDPLF